MNKLLKMSSSSACVLVSCAALALPTVSNVVMEQRDGSRFVEITYDLSGEPGVVTLSIETNGVSIGGMNVVSLAGDVSRVVQPGEGRRILWDARTDWPDHLSRNARARVAAWSTNSPPPYCAVDVSSGNNSSSYPVAYYESAEAVPGGVTNDLYKTDVILMRRIEPTPVGGFLMGSPSSEYKRFDTEDQVSVTLTKSYYIGVYEITQKQWQQVMGDVVSWPSYWNNSSCRDTRPVDQVTYYQIRENNDNTDNADVNWPSNSDVGSGSFMGRLRARTALGGFDLPTEAQWEWACRAGTTGALNDGTANITNVNADARLARLGRYERNGGKRENGSGGYLTPSASWRGCTTENATAKVGSYEPNAWGLYDMHGNVAELCVNWYAATLSGGEDPKGPETGTLRSRRGGSCLDPAQNCRSASRYTKAAWTPREKLWDIGFRPALNIQ